MTFSLYALMNEETPLISNESLALDLKTYFGTAEDFSLQLEEAPFSDNRKVALRWSDWFMSVSYEEGDEVISDSIEIAKRVVSFSEFPGYPMKRRIRVVVGNDDKRKYINAIIDLIGYLKNMPGISIFDPQQNNFL